MLNHRRRRQSFIVPFPARPSALIKRKMVAQTRVIRRREALPRRPHAQIFSRTQPYTRLTLRPPDKRLLPLTRTTVRTGITAIYTTIIHTRLQQGCNNLLARQARLRCMVFHFHIHRRTKLRISMHILMPTHHNIHIISKIIQHYILVSNININILTVYHTLRLRNMYRNTLSIRIRTSIHTRTRTLTPTLTNLINTYKIGMGMSVPRPSLCRSGGSEKDMRISINSHHTCGHQMTKGFAS